MSDIEELYAIAEQAVLDYNTQYVPGWIMRDYIAHALRTYGDQRAAEARERAAEAVEWEAASIAVTYGRETELSARIRRLAAAIRAGAAAAEQTPDADAPNSK